DIAALKKLCDEFAAEIKAIQAHLSTLDKQVANVTAAAAANTALLKRQQFHLYSFLRAPGDYQEFVSAYAGAAGVNGFAGGNAPAGTITPAGGALATSTKLTASNNLGSPGGVAGQNVYFTGTNVYGTAYMVNRLVFSGNVDDNLSYLFRL